jgi:hypothetical protein
MIRDHVREAQKPSAPAATNALRRKCSLCSKKRHLLQRSSDGQQGPKSMPSAVQDVLRSSGRPLEPEARRFFEPRFGHDFGRVRIHTGYKAAESTRKLNALAFTFGEDIVVGDKSSQNKKEALKTLAHELVHVIQQGAALPGGEFEVNDRNSASEREARQVSYNLMAGLPVAVNHSFRGVQRDGGDEEERRRLPPAEASQSSSSQFQQTAVGASLGWPGSYRRPTYQLQLDPSIRAQMNIMQLLTLDSMRRSLLLLDYSTIAASQPPPWLSTSAVPATQPGQPLVPRGAGPSEPRAATTGDLVRAVMRIPAVDSALTRLQTEASGQARHAWHELSTGERVILLTQTALIGGGTLAGILSSTGARQFALEQLQGRDLPVPGIRGLTFRLNLAGPERSVMFNLDVGQLLPPSLGF